MEPWELRRRLGDLTVRAGGLDHAGLPKFGYPSDGNGECIIEDKFGYVYLHLSNGRTVFEESRSNADRLCYEVLRRRAEELALRDTSDPGRDPVERKAIVRQDVATILAKVNPQWAQFFLRMPPQSAIP